MSVRIATIAAGLALMIGVTSANAETIKIGVTPGPHAQVLEVVKPIAAKKGLDIQITEFSDYVIPNTALDAGELQANSFQHQPFLDNQKADRGFKIESVGAKLDPNRHQAMVELPSDQEPGTIVQEMQAGYMIKDRLLRPALVGVAKAAE